jgi:hypothetical protein
MVDHIVDASAPRGHVEIRSGVGRRRRWSNADKGRIVAESFAPGAVVSEMARRHEISPQHLFAWRKAARPAVTNPRIRVCSTVVFRALSLAMRNRFISHYQILYYDGTRAFNVIDYEHQSSTSSHACNPPAPPSGVQMSGVIR